VPAIDFSALLQQIHARKLAPLYVLVGEDVKLIERMVDAIEATIDEPDRPFAIDRVYAAEPGGWPIDIAASARALPMLGDRRIVIVLRAERLLKPKRAARSVDVEDADPDAAEEDTAIDFAPLEEYVNDPVPSTSLVFVATAIDRGRRFSKRLDARAQVVSFGGIGAGGPPGARQDARSVATDLVRGEMTHAGRTIDPPALALLVDRAGGDITKLRGDLERLLLYTEGQKRISREDVSEIVSEGAPEDDWAVVNAIADQDTARALRETGRRLDRGDSVHMLVGQLRWWVSNRLVQMAPGRVRPAIDALLRTDLALKSSGGDERVLVERLVVELAAGGGPVSRPFRAG